MSNKIIANWPQLYSLASKLNITLNDHTSEFPYFPNLLSLKLRGFPKLSTVTNLSHLKKLYLQDCWELVDVSCLRNLEDLTIDSSYTTDVSALGNIRYLTLLSCYRLKDISKLANNYKLYIIGCSMITVLPSVFNSTILMVNGLSKKPKFPIDSPRLKNLYITDDRLDPFLCFPLLNLFSVELFDASGLKLFPEMRRIPVITLDQSEELEDISDLGENKCVGIYYCPKLTDFSSLKNVPHVLVDSCPGFCNVHEVENVQHLSIFGCTNFSYSSPLKKIRHLELLDWVSRVDVGIWDIPVLEVSLIIALNYFLNKQLNNKKIVIYDMSETIPLSIRESTKNYNMTRNKNQVVFIRKG
jgi:hypothetical protein